MWYSGGDQYEPNAIGYATSRDGLKWSKHENNPIFKPNRIWPGKKTGLLPVRSFRRRRYM